MNINDQLQPIVQSLLDNLSSSIEQEVREKITDQVTAKLAGTELTDIVNNLVAGHLDNKIKQLDFEKVTKAELDKLIYQITTNINNNLSTAANEHIAKEVNKQVAQINISELIRSTIERKLADMVNTSSFPLNSIPYTSINLKGLVLNGDMIKGGIIEQFGSTGIEDRSTHVQMTIMDHATAFEGPVWAPEAIVKGALTVEGDLILRGRVDGGSAFTELVDNTATEVQKRLNSELFKSYSDLVTTAIKNDGLDLDRITQNGRDIVKGNQLGYHIIDTNIQRLGIVTDFQTKGENLLSQTLYVTDGRAGVNTMDPSAVFVVWDEEVEMIVTKRRQDTGYIGTPRYQKMVLGSNNKDNLVLDTDGSVHVNELHIGKLKIKHSDTIPNYEGQIGDIVFYAYPTIGGPIGWVCLGSTRWAKFGTITE